MLKNFGSSLPSNYTKSLIIHDFHSIAAGQDIREIFMGWRIYEPIPQYAELFKRVWL
ncbi:MAG: hypothetical protein WCO45_04660 [Pseudanabaena sp. ELA607]